MVTIIRMRMIVHPAVAVVEHMRGNDEQYRGNQ